MHELLCVALVLSVEGHPLAQLDDVLAEYDKALDEPTWVDPRTWGTTAAEWDAMMSAFPPAPPRAKPVEVEHA
jgi:hypothetical protein